MKTVKTMAVALLALTWVGGDLGSSVNLLSTPALAQSKEKPGKVGAKVGKPLKEAQELAQKGKFQDALAKVKEAQAIADKTPFETFTINEFLGYVAVNLKDYATAAKAYEATINSGLVPTDQYAQRLKATAQLYYQVKNYPKATEYSNRYLKEVGPDSELSLMIAQAYYLTQDYAKAATAVNQVIDAAAKAGKPVKEDWLQLAMSAEFKLGDMAAVQKSLKSLVARYPSAEYWQQLLDIMQRQPGLSDRNNLDIYRLRNATGALKAGDEMVEMAQLAIQAGLPGEAEAVLEKGFATNVLGGNNKERELRLLNMAKSQAATDQKSLPAFDKEAAAAKTGDADVKLGEAYMSYGQYDQAIAAIQRGIAKGGLKNSDDAQMRLGLAYLKAGKKAEALTAFRAVKSDPRLAEIAGLWTIIAGQA